MKLQRLFTITNFNRLIGLLTVLYICSMFIYPWYNGGWNNTHSVWHYWQSLNVGILAFLSSIIAFNISRYNANKQREREFTAARAFLPEALSELSSHLSESIKILKEAEFKVKNNDTRTALTNPKPLLPEKYRPIFSNCIATAEPYVGEHLSTILVELQIHDSRLEGFHRSFAPNSPMTINTYNLNSNLYDIAKLKALIDKTFGFARGTDNLDTGPLIIDDLINALLNLGTLPEVHSGLTEHFKKEINRNE